MSMLRLLSLNVYVVDQRYDGCSCVPGDLHTYECSSKETLNFNYTFTKYLDQIKELEKHKIDLEEKKDKKKLEQIESRIKNFYNRADFVPYYCDFKEFTLCFNDKDAM